jgi:hypothetical protein
VAAVTADQPTVLSDRERGEILARALTTWTSWGWRVESQGPTQAQLVKGKHTSHLLHFFLGLFTLGLWWITVWPAVTLLGGQKQKFLTVDEYGNVLTR